MRTILRLAVAAGALASLTACADGKFQLGQKRASDPAVAGADVGAAAADPAFSLVERDVEAPEAFRLTDKGLWDGRPSLGGVWVAHANVKDPERVIIRNPSNGKSVIGALFRREVSNPGPALQVSSDAASALGMLAGQPASLEVVALRREQPPKPEAAATAAKVADEGGEKTGTADAAGGLDPIAAGAAAAIARAEGATDGAAKTADAGAAAPAAGTDAASAAATGAAQADRPCPFWRKKKCLAERAAAGSEPSPADGAAEGAATADASATAAASPASAPAGAVAGAVAVSALPATPAAAGTLTRPYVQIGIFSVEANAQRAVDQMKAAGMTASIRADQSQGKKFWRVVIGPTASVAERDGIAVKVKGLGYPDAYPVSK